MHADANAGPHEPGSGTLASAWPPVPESITDVPPSGCGSGSAPVPALPPLVPALPPLVPAPPPVSPAVPPVSPAPPPVSPAPPLSPAVPVIPASIIGIGSSPRPASPMLMPASLMIGGSGIGTPGIASTPGSSGGSSHLPSSEPPQSPFTT